MAANLPAGHQSLWAAILAPAIGPNLLTTGLVATLIAWLKGAKVSTLQFTAIGLALVPLQVAAAPLGLHITGALR